MKARLVDYLHHNIQHGILTVENASVEEVQKTIRKIINNFYNADFLDWNVDDISKEFPKEWEWGYVSCDVDCVIGV